MLLLITPTIMIAAPCTAIDGDTIRCGREVIRLIGIDAPEMPGHCRAPRVCVPGDGAAAKRNLARLIRFAPVKMIRFGRDKYGRSLAIAFADRVNLSCAQINAGHAIYKPKWDKGGRVGRACQQPQN